MDDGEIFVVRTDDGVPAAGSITVGDDVYEVTDADIKRWKDAGNTNWGGWGQELELDCKVCND